MALLDGGWVKWAAENRSTNTETPAVARTTFAIKGGTVKVATADDVRDAINKAGTKLLDARTQGEIDGKDLRNIKRGGYIESSVPVYWEDTLDPTTKAFKSAAEITKLYRDRGIQPADNVITYCQIGMRASHDLFTLALIGHDLTKLANYYGSWEEWGNREDTPIKTNRKKPTTGSTYHLGRLRHQRARSADLRRAAGHHRGGHRGRVLSARTTSGAHRIPSLRWPRSNRQRRGCAAREICGDPAGDGVNGLVIAQHRAEWRHLRRRPA